MQRQLATLLIFTLTMLLTCGSFLLNLIGSGAVNNEVETEGRFLGGLFGFSAGVGFGLTFILVPESWLEKYLHPYYQRSEMPYKVIAGLFSMGVGIIGIIVVVFRS